MKVFRSLDEVQLSASACAIGMFDGMHVGHRMVLENALRQSRILGVPSVVFSFANHPQFLISQTPTPLLSSLEERLAVCEAMGFDAALILDFTPALKDLSAPDFVQTILVKHLGVKSVTVGYDHRFGKGRQGDGAFLTQSGEALGFETQIIEPVRVHDQIVSSTLIRKLVSFGEMGQAENLLGRPYFVEALVEEGMQRGRKLGFPTANLAMPLHRLVPAMGTYSGKAYLKGEVYPAVANIGLSPTFGDQSQKRVEVHLIGYSGSSFYGEPLKFEIHRKIREEKKFSAIEELIFQIQKDCDEVMREWQTGNFNEKDFDSPRLQRRSLPEPSGLSHAAREHEARDSSRQASSRNSLSHR
ncbi:MAG: riboflavin biosynthesis protein RibF [Cyanobacteria bacterium]|nr:riboflavin biosynthesis protein RibF [Cyanobacteriota bacterium]